MYVEPIGTFAFGDSDESFGGPLGVTEDAGFQEFSSLAISEPEAIKDKDVQNSEEIGFEAFQLSEDVLKGIAGLGWVHPLPVQAKAIPMILQKQE